MVGTVVVRLHLFSTPHSLVLWIKAMERYSTVADDSQHFSSTQRIHKAIMFHMKGIVYHSLYTCSS